MSNLCSFVDTQNLNYFLSSSQAVYLNDNQFEINDNFLHTVSKNLCQCNYFDTDSQCFRNLKNQLFLLHVNIRSLQKNFESFLDFLQTFEKLPDLICVSETKLKSLPLRNLSIPNYEFYFSNSPTNADGVAIYISKHFIVHNTSKQLIGITGCEDLWLKFGDRTNHSQYLVGSIYRHPSSNCANFIEAFNDSLAQFLTSNIKLFVLGDLNIDISDTNRTSTASNYLNMI